MAYPTENIYKTYHRNLTNLVIDDDTKLFTGFFNLKSTDVLNIDLSDVIYINGSNYIINTVKDYNAINNQITKVELIKFDKYIT